MARPSSTVRVPDRVVTATPVVPKASYRRDFDFTWPAQVVFAINVRSPRLYVPETVAATMDTRVTLDLSSMFQITSPRSGTYNIQMDLEKNAPATDDLITLPERKVALSYLAVNGGTVYTTSVTFPGGLVVGDYLTIMVKSCAVSAFSSQGFPTGFTPLGLIVTCRSRP